MLIRSQDKTALVNLNDHAIHIEYEREGEYTIYASCKHYLKMGTYSSEENAIKVLDMIQDAYEKYEYEKAFKTGLRLFDTFQMPEDDEVTEN